MMAGNDSSGFLPCEEIRSRLAKRRICGTTGMLILTEPFYIPEELLRVPDAPLSRASPSSDEEDEEHNSEYSDESLMEEDFTPELNRPKPPTSLCSGEEDEDYNPEHTDESFMEEDFIKELTQPKSPTSLCSGEQVDDINVHGDGELKSSESGDASAASSNKESSIEEAGNESLNKLKRKTSIGIHSFLKKKRLLLQ